MVGVPASWLLPNTSFSSFATYVPSRPNATLNSPGSPVHSPLSQIYEKLLNVTVKTGELQALVGWHALCWIHRGNTLFCQVTDAIGFSRLECHMIKKLHVKRTATNRFALCGVLPEKRFILLEAVSREFAQAICKTCFEAATHNSTRPRPAVGRDGAIIPE